MNCYKGYKYFSNIHVSMHYYTFKLDEALRNLCTICTPFRNNWYNCLPISVCLSLDIAQEIIEDFCAREETDIYINDVGTFGNDWPSHVYTLKHVLTIFQDNKFMVDPLKCKWAVKETNWLGYWLTP